MDLYTKHLYTKEIVHPRIKIAPSCHSIPMAFFVLSQKVKSGSCVCNMQITLKAATEGTFFSRNDKNLHLCIEETKSYGFGVA